MIPVGVGQRSDAEANRLVEWLLFNGIQVTRLTENTIVNGQAVERGSYVVPMKQAHRGLADTALGIGVDVSPRISILYAPPAAWSHGFLWGADILSIPNGTAFTARTSAPLKKPDRIGGGIDHGNAEYYALRLNSATAVRAVDSLLDGGLTAKLALAPFTRPDGRTFPAGTVLFAASPETKEALGEAGRQFGLFFWRVHSTALSLEDIDRSPRIAVLSGAVDQAVWSLRSLGLTADPVNTPLNSATGPDPLLNYDVVWTTANWPGNTTARARLTDFFARGGGFIGAGFVMGTHVQNNGVTNLGFLANSGQRTGLSSAFRNLNNESGIIRWSNTGGSSSLITGAYPTLDTAIVDPPAWYTAVPSGWAVDANMPLSGFFAAGLWQVGASPQRAWRSARRARAERGWHLTDDGLRVQPALPGGSGARVAGAGLGRTLGRPVGAALVGRGRAPLPTVIPGRRAR